MNFDQAWKEVAHVSRQQELHARMNAAKKERRACEPWKLSVSTEATQLLLDMDNAVADGGDQAHVIALIACALEDFFNLGFEIGVKSTEEVPAVPIQEIAKDYNFVGKGAEA